MNTYFISAIKTRFQRYILPSLQGRGLGVGLLLLVCLCMTGCSKDDNPSTPRTITDKDLVGLWWDEYKYSDVTETGDPFTRVILAVLANEDHTGCIYLGAFNDNSDEPVALYGGPKNAGFTWQLLDNGTLQLADPVTGEIWAQTRSDGGSYGDNATDVSNTNLSYAPGKVTMTNESYSGTLAKANAQQAEDIVKKLSIPTPSTNLGSDDDLNINDTPQDTWGR